MMELDNELAEATDAILNGREMPDLQDENRELAEVVRDLYRAIDPATPPSAAFQQRLNARLNSEWDRSNVQPTLRLVDRPLVRLAALAGCAKRGRRLIQAPIRMNKTRDLAYFEIIIVLPAF
jgi:hypothetical protein